MPRLLAKNLVVARKRFAAGATLVAKRVIVAKRRTAGGDGNHKLEVRDLKPKFGINYGLGYIGFVSHPKKPSIVSRGIAWFERWDQMSNISVTHAFIVTAKDECVEALAEEGIVRSSNLKTKYFDEPNVYVFFRKPKGMAPEVGSAIAKAAQEQIGARYDRKLIAAMAANNSFLGKGIRDIFGPQVAEKLDEWLHTPGHWICSELAAHCLEAQPEYKNKGILAHPVYTINPQALFEDQVIFELWRKGSPKKSFI